MSQRIQNKIDSVKRMASHSSGVVVSGRKKVNTDDSLSKLIRTKRDGDMFLAELEIAVKTSR